MRQPRRPNSTTGAIDRVVSRLMEAHVASASRRKAWSAEKLEPPPELRKTVRLVVQAIAERMKPRARTSRASERRALTRITSLAAEFTGLLRGRPRLLRPEVRVPPDLLTKDEIALGKPHYVRLPLNDDLDPERLLERIEMIGRAAARDAARIPEGKGSASVEDSQGLASAQLVCGVAGEELCRSATGRVPGKANRAFVDILDELWIGAGGTQPSASFWERTIAFVLKQDTDDTAGKLAALMDARAVVKEAFTRGGLLLPLFRPWRIPEPPRLTVSERN